jgi:P pilus assembly chaperone PapD
LSARALRKGACRRLFWGAAAAFVLELAAAPTRAELSVSPTLIVFDDEHATKAITIENTGRKELVVRVSLINLRMLPDGHMVRAAPGVASEHFATDMVRFSPHELVLDPGASEVVRLQVPPLEKRADGEYRTHVLIQQVPDIAALRVSPFERTDGVSVDLQAVLGVAVPLLIRRGEPSARVRIEALRIERAGDGQTALAVRLERQGERSVRGALSLTLDGSEIETYDGLAIYAPAPARELLLALPKDTPVLSGRLEVRFRENEETRDPVDIRAVLDVPPH